MHTGIDFPAPTGTRVAAAGRGVVRFAGYDTGGYGNLVIVKHRLGFETWYAHLSTETSYVGEPVVGGTRVGLVGSTGHSTGPPPALRGAPQRSSDRSDAAPARHRRRRLVAARAERRAPAGPGL